ncbi:MAG: glutathione S-transferase domain-containing protein, partial [Rhodobacteraceae bacterium]|nr:glutathione S-transferase domain-containing protein [Paracoccaceae bacterium]
MLAKGGTAQMADVELLSYEACPYAQRTRMALIEKDIPFTLTE